MQPSHIFISHASKDDGFVKELRFKLESQGLTVWVDSRNLRGGAKLAPEIEKAIEEARQIIVVLSPNTVNSPWVRKEIQKALEVEQQRNDESYRVIPLLLPGIEPSALALWFDEEPVGIRVELKTGSVSEALPLILAALGECLPEDHQPSQEVEAQPVAELVLKLSDAKIETVDGKTRAKAPATLIYEPADKSRNIESQRYYFTAPLGPIESDDLRWYLEEYFRWPTGVFKDRAARIEAQLPLWGQELFQSALAGKTTQQALNAWLQAANDTQRRFSVMVDSELPEGASEQDQAATNAAASALLSLPWELLHDGRSFLFHGANPVRVRRRLPNRFQQKPAITNLPIRILLVSPRPEEEGTAYIDHRISAKPLVEAIENLGELAEFTILSPPTFPALEGTLRKAAEAKQQFDVIHFDGHGIYDHKRGLGALCFEDPKDCGKLEKRAMELIHAERLAALIRERRIPLVFLEACQSAKTEGDPTASVAAKLLEEGVTSIVAMSHSVLVETARRFVAAFYQELAQGARVGKAMLAGQLALHHDTFRGRVMGAGELRLQDWFVPVLYQEEQDLQLVTQLPTQTVQMLQHKQRRLSFGQVHAEKERMQHEFVGRSRELLKLERMLANTQQRYAVIRGRGGEGKTTLAVELAYWLVSTRRFERAAFVSLEQYTDARSMLDSLGRQLLPEGDKWSVAHYATLDEAQLHVDRALRDNATIIVVDNVESVLPNAFEPAEIALSREKGLGKGELEDKNYLDSSHPDLLPDGEGTNTNKTDDNTFQLIADLLQQFLHADPATRLIFTSREPLSEPFAHRHRIAEIGALSPNDAIDLVSQVMKQEGLEPKYDDAGTTPEEITELVEAVGCHARALTLLAREIAKRGVRATTGNVQHLMAELDRKHPGDRENSLYASVELSLRRLPPDVRKLIKVLGVFHGGANLIVLSQMLGLEPEAVRDLTQELVEVGLGEMLDHHHLQLDPALPSYLLMQMDEAEREQAESAWAAGMWRLALIFHQQRSEAAEFAVRLILIELPNLLALLEWARRKVTAEELANYAGILEDLLANLGRPLTLARVVAVREQAAQALEDWNHTWFNTETNAVARLLDSGAVQSAYTAAQKLLQQTLKAGENAYPEIAYDTALAYHNVGLVLSRSGNVEAALQPLAEAKRRFQVLVDQGNTGAGHMLLSTVNLEAGCLGNLGQLERAKETYQECLKHAQKGSDMRSVALIKMDLGRIFQRQQRYHEALAKYSDALEAFEKLKDLRSVADTWLEIGIAHTDAGQFEQAEQPYRQALAISVQQKDRPREAGSLNELGLLYGLMNRREEAVSFCRQSAGIRAELKDFFSEGRARGNIAETLFKLGRYDEARQELQRAIECGRPYGHNAELWMYLDILHDVELASGNAQAAMQAREQAIGCFLAFRKDGGESSNPSVRLCKTVAEVIRAHFPSAIEPLIARVAEDVNTPARSRILHIKLQAILHGERDPALVDDPELYYQDAVELLLLLEALQP